MSTVKTLSFNSPHGFSAEVQLCVAAYANNGSLYIGLVEAESGEPFTDITVNMHESAVFPPFQAAVKNYSENDGMESFIKESGLGNATGQVVSSGYVKAPVYQFDREKLLEFSINGVHEY